MTAAKCCCISCYCSLGDLLVHTSDRYQTEVVGTFACQLPCCRTCQYTMSNVHVHRPKSSTTIREHFTCKWDNIGILHLVPSMSLRLHSGETRLTLSERCGEHIRSMENLEHTWFSCGGAFKLSQAHSVMIRHSGQRTKDVFWIQNTTETLWNGKHF